MKHEERPNAEKVAEELTHVALRARLPQISDLYDKLRQDCSCVEPYIEKKDSKVGGSTLLKSMKTEHRSTALAPQMKSRRQLSRSFISNLQCLSDLHNELIDIRQYIRGSQHQIFARLALLNDSLIGQLPGASRPLVNGLAEARILESASLDLLLKSPENSKDLSLSRIKSIATIKHMEQLISNPRSIESPTHLLNEGLIESYWMSKIMGLVMVWGSLTDLLPYRSVQSSSNGIIW